MNKFNKILLSYFLRDQSYSKEFFGLIYITVIAYCVLVVSPAFKHFPISGFNSYVFLLLSWLFISLVSGVVIFVSALNRWVFALFFPVYIIVSGVISFYMSKYNVEFNNAVIVSTIYTNNQEAFSQISWFFSFYIIVLFGVSFFIVLKRFKIRKVRIQWFNFSMILVGLLLIYFTNKPRVLRTIYYSPYSLIFGLNECIDDGFGTLELRKEISEGAKCNADSLTIVVVVGEAMRADHVSLNGYSRETFPLMEKEKPVSFKNIYSEWTYTLKSLPHIFTRADSVNHKPSTNEKTFISIFNSCHYQSWWIGNQDLNKYLMPLAEDCDSIKFFSYNKENKRYDGAMLPSIENSVNSPASRKLIVVHQFGCHWWYPSSYPKEFEKFTPVMVSKNITDGDSLKIVNSYDNVACYTDYFLSEIVKLLKEKNAVMIYLSDHGELLGENGKWIHAQNTEYEKNPACVVWFSEEYARNFPDKVNAAMQNKDKRFRSDLLFHTALDAGEIDSPFKVNDLSLFKNN